MTRTQWSALAGAGLALLLVVTTPSDAIECVNPTGAFGCFTSIQAAVNAASPGETVLVAPGSYFETVDIGTAGLKLLGTGLIPGQVILDPDTPNSGNGIDITADDVTIKNLTVRNGTSNGINIDTGADGVRIIKVHIRGPNSDCIHDHGVGTLVEYSELIGCGSNGIESHAGAADLTVQRSEIRLCDSRCIDVDANGATIEHNEIAVATDGDCIEIDGNNARVRWNTVKNCDDDGIDVDGDNAVVSHNEVSGADEDGIDLFGNAFTVSENRVSFVRDDGYEIDCSPCTSGLVARNTATNVGMDEDEGFDIFATAAGLVVEWNIASRGQDDGFEISGTGIVIRHNQALDNGGDAGENGFDIFGTGHTIYENVARGNHDDGFDIDGTGHTLSGNVAERNLEDGFDIDADGTTLTSNRARFNNATGIEVSAAASGTTLTGNTAFGNRQDLCNDGAGTVDGGGNSFGTGGFATACDPID